eukprot:TRINITY_DN18204_c0_g1_i2.p1 TRINITY_DN18204_c0_g1~~TRINITY_DN18204_c0_g1_i2.p1  ORF type:complete len:702 (-),score=114.23 TRINITY_DN18204_c0_g1_i2:180-2264(-)
MNRPLIGQSQFSSCQYCTCKQQGFRSFKRKETSFLGSSLLKYSLVKQDFISQHKQRRRICLQIKNLNNRVPEFPVGHPYRNGDHLRMQVPLPHKYNVFKQTDEQFHECVKELREWKERIRVSYIPQTVHDVPLLGMWLAAMRRSFKFTKWKKYMRGRRKAVKQKRMKTLSLADWKWEVIDRVGVDWKIGQPDSFWWHHFHNARRFYEVYGHVNIPRFANIGWDQQWQGIRKWLPKVQKHYYQGKLSPVRAASCRDIGIKLPKRVHPIQQRVKEQLRRELGIYSVDEETKDWEEFEQLRKDRLKQQADTLKSREMQDAEKRRPKVVNQIQELRFDDLDVTPMGGLTIIQQRQEQEEQKRKDRLGLNEPQAQKVRQIQTRHANNWDFGEEEDDSDIIDLEVFDEDEEDPRQYQNQLSSGKFDFGKGGDDDDEVDEDSDDENGFVSMGSQSQGAKSQLPFEQGEELNSDTFISSRELKMPNLNEYGDIDIGMLIRERGSPFRENVQDTQDVELNDEDEENDDELDDGLEAKAVVGYILPSRPDWYKQKKLDENEYFEKVMMQRETPRIQSIEFVKEEMKQTIQFLLNKAKNDNKLNSLQRSILYRQALGTYLTYRAIPVVYWFDWWKLLLPVVAHDWELVEQTFEKVLKDRHVNQYEWVADLQKAVKLMESYDDDLPKKQQNFQQPTAEQQKIKVQI